MTAETNALPDRRMVDFINRHHVLTLATAHNNKAWCCQCFYVYINDRCGLAFSSDSATRHITESLAQPIVAASIVLETKNIAKVQGMQLEGHLQAASGELLKEIQTAYLKRFPVALLIDTKFWFLELTTIKMTDNRLGFGKKLHWQRM